MRLHFLSVTLAFGLTAMPANGQASDPPLVCAVERKLDSERVYSADDLTRGQFTVEITLRGAKTFLRRCSFSPSAGRVTCDEYEADEVVTDPVIGVRKFYYFRGQFDVQVFRNGSFVENNGRGGIAFGRCRHP